MFKARIALPLAFVFLLMGPSSSQSSDQLPIPPSAALTSPRIGKAGTIHSSLQTQSPALSVPLAPPPLLTPIETPIRADRVVIKKSERLLYLMKDDHILKSYRIALGRNPKGHKVRIGDHKTPEGEYVIDWRNPNSKYYLSMHISYPNKRDVEKARKLGVTPGGAIMIHGLPNGLGWIKEMHRVADWTKGCIAVTNEEMEEIWECVPNGTPIRIDG